MPSVFFAQSFNADKTALTNFLIRMYKHAPFDVKVVNDYSDNYLVSAVVLDPAKYGGNESTMLRVASVKAMSQASRYFNGSSITADLLITTKEDAEGKNGKKKAVERKLFPCYILIKMRYTDSLWHTIVNSRGVTGFVGPQGRPLPLTDEEVKKMKLEPIVIDIKVEVGQKVKISKGDYRNIKITTPEDLEIAALLYETL